MIIIVIKQAAAARHELRTWNDYFRDELRRAALLSSESWRS